jgi:hypothetical protein
MESITEQRAGMLEQFDKLNERFEKNETEMEMIMRLNFVSAELEEKNILKYLESKEFSQDQAIEDINALKKAVDDIMDYRDEEFDDEKLEQKKNILINAHPFLDNIFNFYIDASQKEDETYDPDMDPTVEELEELIKKLGFYIEQYK